MPIYDFACSACDHRFERLQKMSDADPTTCPKCGLETVSKQVTAPSFRLAGSGWYETDFKQDSDKKKNLADSKPAPEKPAAEKPAVSSTPAATAPTKSE
mgnify:FL=1